MPEFNYGSQNLLTASAPFTKHHGKICNLKYLYRNELDKACFVHDAAHSDSNDLAKKTISDKVLKDRAYEIPKNSKYDGYQRALATMFFYAFDKKTGFKRFKRRKTINRFKDNISAANVAEIGSLSSKNKNLGYLLCVIDVFTKYA